MGRRGRPAKNAASADQADGMPACRKHPDCFACRDGRCEALSDNRFGRRRCPFYKTRDKNCAEQQRCLRRLVELGRDDLLEKYGEVLGDLGVLDGTVEEMDGIAGEMERFRREDMERAEREILGDIPEGDGPDLPAELDDLDDLDDADDWDDLDGSDDAGSLDNLDDPHGRDIPGNPDEIDGPDDLLDLDDLDDLYGLSNAERPEEMEAGNVPVCRR